MLKKTILFVLFVCLMASYTCGQDATPIKTTLPPKFIGTVYQRAHGEIVGYLSNVNVSLFQNDSPLMSGVTDTQGVFFTEDLTAGNYSVIIEANVCHLSEAYDFVIEYEWNSDSGRYEAYADFIVDVSDECSQALKKLDGSQQNPDLPTSVDSMTNPSSFPGSTSGTSYGAGPSGMGAGMMAAMVGGVVAAVVVAATANSEPESPFIPRSK